MWFETHGQLQSPSCRPPLPASCCRGFLRVLPALGGHSEVGVCIVTTNARTLRPEKGAVWGWGGGGASPHWLPRVPSGTALHQRALPSTQQ